MGKSITIKELAAKANVSIATVSMVLNKKDKKISEATRAKILELAKEHNYTPNTMARSLITRRTNTIGLVIPDIVNPFFPEIARGVEDKASEFGYSVIYCNTDDNIKREDKYINVLREKMVDGIIFAHSSDRDNNFDSLDKCKVPIILIDRDYENKNVAGRVMVDNKLGAYRATSYLLEQGYKNIAYIAGSTATNTAIGRLKGYEEALKNKNIPIREERIKVGEYKLQWGATAVEELIGGKVEIDAIFCGNDLIAIGAMKKLKEYGLRVPEDMGVVGFDDIYLASLVEPPLTTIKQPNYDMGYEAAGLLIKSIETLAKDKLRFADTEKVEEEGTLVLPTELIVRKSTK